jgi:hypothetical protein
MRPTGALAMGVAFNSGTASTPQARRTPHPARRRPARPPSPPCLCARTFVIKHVPIAAPSVAARLSGGVSMAGAVEMTAAASTAAACRAAALPIPRPIAGPPERGDSFGIFRSSASSRAVVNSRPTASRSGVFGRSYFGASSNGPRAS